MHEYRTHNCGQLGLENIGQKIKLAGWIHNIRDLGGLLFIDLRDHYGFTQVVTEDIHLKNIIVNIPRESTISVTGTVMERPDNTKNRSTSTGFIEVKAEDILILGKVMKSLPFEISTAQDAREELRLKYRFLDIRSNKLHNNIVLRSNVIQSIRNKMISKGFIEIQTPILTSSSPEGARDYLVPSRVHPGKFYALPQAPQQFKQLLMVGGFDKYFQIAPCFRDEDARADRSPGEFYQLDIEMAFSTQEDVFNHVEDLLYKVFTEFTTWKVNKPFPRIPYSEAMLRYGNDKPDLRNPLVIYDVTSLFENADIKFFIGKKVRVINIPGCGKQTRSFFDNMVSFAVDSGAKGLSWIKINDDLSLSGSIAKFISDNKKFDLIKTTNAQPGDAMFFIADQLKDVERLSGIVRNELGKRLDLIEKNVYKFCWVVDFPMYEFNEENNGFDFCHNPFSMPQGGMNALNNMHPLEILAYQYDIVCNGIELSSGAVRNHDPEIMIKAFEIAGYPFEDIEKKFPALFNAFHYGAPPHAGIAPGIDRIVMMIANEPNIREVVAFPMNSKAQDLLMGAPSYVTEKQLNDIHIKIVLKKQE